MFKSKGDRKRTKNGLDEPNFFVMTTKSRPRGNWQLAASDVCCMEQRSFVLLMSADIIWENLQVFCHEDWGTTKGGSCSVATRVESEGVRASRAS